MPMFASRQEAQDVAAACEAMNELLSRTSVREIVGLKDEIKRVADDVAECRRTADVTKMMAMKEIEKEVKGICSILQQNVDEIRSSITPEKILDSLKPTLDQAVDDISEQVENHILDHLNRVANSGRLGDLQMSLRASAVVPAKDQTPAYEHTEFVSVQQLEVLEARSESVTKQHNDAIANLEAKIGEVEVLAQTLSAKCEDIAKDRSIALNAAAPQDRISSEPQETWHSGRSSKWGFAKAQALSGASTRESTASSLPSAPPRSGAAETGVFREAQHRPAAGTDAGVVSGDFLSSCVPTETFSEPEWRWPVRKCI
eukprot:TRINITY_DN22285_c0_g1_i1.p1 TRINITY_DN22285_c0_g1~~TRINITY_DN22285_c0_g1_i1.p1  ORF type:complete len:326 (+),score=61.76 TRINITY_DN22285_c0_g1_i1:35-979(+)